MRPLCDGQFQVSQNSEMDDFLADPRSVATVAASLAAIAAAIAAFISLPFTVRAANAARAQTHLQRQMAEQAMQPNVWVDCQPDIKQGSVLQLVLTNEGPTVARNVKVLIDPALPVSEGGFGKYADVAQTKLASGISSIAPGRSIEWPLGLAHELLDSKMPQVYTLRLTARGPYGEIEPVEFEIDLADWREARDAPSGSLHLVRSSVDKVATELKKLRESLP